MRDILKSARLWFFNGVAITIGMMSMVSVVQLSGLDYYLFEDHKIARISYPEDIVIKEHYVVSQTSTVYIVGELTLEKNKWRKVTLETALFVQDKFIGSCYSSNIKPEHFEHPTFEISCSRFSNDITKENFTYKIRVREGELRNPL